MQEKNSVQTPYIGRYLSLESGRQEIFIPHEKNKKINNVRDTDILSDDDQCRLIQIREYLLASYFEIGDIANDTATASAKNGLPVTQARIFDAVGRFCGKSGRTVRYYTETSSFYPQEIREAYDILPFAFFVFARSLGNDWRSVLDFCMLNPSMTLDALKIRFADGEVLGIDDDFSLDFDGEQELSPKSGNILVSVLGDLVDTLSRLLDGVRLRESTRAGLLDSMVVIRESIPEIVEATRN